MPSDRPARPGIANPLFLHLVDPPDDVIQLICAAPDAPPPELVTAYEIRACAPLVIRLARLRTIDDLSGNVVAQLAAAELLADLDGLRNRRVAVLRHQHDHLCAELARHLPDWSFRPASGGQTLWVELPRGDATSFAQVALRHGVAVLPGGSLDPTGGSQRHLRIPFLAALAELSEAVRRLAGAWSSYDGQAGRRSAMPALVV